MGNLYDNYIEWMKGIIYEKRKIHDFEYLISTLARTPFIYDIPMDGNRVEDAIALRYRFADESYVDRLEIKRLDDVQVSVLEVLLALSIRCQETIMDGTDEENDTLAKWFWIMLDNLGLSQMNDAHFNESEAMEIIDRLLLRQYEPDGRGGLFTVNKKDIDMRDVEIWYQMLWYLDELE